MEGGGPPAVPHTNPATAVDPCQCRGKRVVQARAGGDRARPPAFGRGSVRAGAPPSDLRPGLGVPGASLRRLRRLRALGGVGAKGEPDALFEWKGTATTALSRRAAALAASG